MISIFAKRAFLNTSPNTEFVSKEMSYHGRGHLQRVSSMIRADQIVDFLGKDNARLNPDDSFENDVCIYVKPHLKKGMDMKFSGQKAYIDIIDGANLGDLLRNHPEVGCITCSASDYLIMKKELPQNDVILIPQHHCNFERKKKNIEKIKKVGIIGEKNAFDYLPKEIDEELKKRNIELIKCSNFFSRQDIVDFYMNIDIQIIWRPYKKILSNPLKIVNASSFGVPTIALDEPAFKEVVGAYVPVNSFKEWLEELDYLIDNPNVYKLISKNCLYLAESYHIENVSYFYKQLERKAWMN